MKNALEVRKMDGKEVCLECGTRFILSKHHTEDHHLNRHHKKKNKATKILCETCHYEKDFIKNIKCYSKAMMKRYNRKNKKVIG